MDRTLPAKQRLRAMVLLMAAEGADDTNIAGLLRTTRQRCGRIRKRFLAKGLQALAKDLPRSGRPKQIDPQKIITLTTTTPDTAAVWSRALMAKEAGVSASSVGRIWDREGIKPRSGPLRLSNDPHFAEKLEAIVGLYLAPPIRVLALCADTNRSREAVTRISLPPGSRRTTLAAALKALEKSLLSTGQVWRGHWEFMRFLEQIDTQIPDSQELHLFIRSDQEIVTPPVTAWLAKHPHLTVVWRAMRYAWCYKVDRFFRSLTTHRLQHGMVQSMAQLEAAITEYIETPKAVPKPFSWTAKVADLSAKDAAR
ncbi:MAG: hypothetical protein JW395_4001 [Nitrospira sp.]|nr:hypothetical protein [Nitrospira sp.]